MIDLLIKNVKKDYKDPITDIAIDNGFIIDHGPKLDYFARQIIDGKNQLVIPGLIESHLHLDIALMNSWKMPGRQEPFHSMKRLNDLVEILRKGFSRQDIEQRAGLALEMASRNGTVALRAQCHLDPEIGLKHIEALQTVKEKYKGRVDLQIVAFPQQGLLRNPKTKDLFREAFRIGADVIGCATTLDYDENGNFIPKAHIDAVFDLAEEFDIPIDAHVDASILENVNYDDFEITYLAEQTIQHGYFGRVAAGHVTSLDSAKPDVADRVIEKIKEANMTVVAVPDLYRVGRDDIRHVRRGLTRIKELLAAGVNVAYASNNVRDCLRPMGNMDLLEETRSLVDAGHMDTVDQLYQLMNMITYNAARAIGFENYGLEIGCRADMVVLAASSIPAAVIGQAEKSYVFKNGRIMASNQVISGLYNGDLVYSNFH